jgi:hypothetical protein
VLDLDRSTGILSSVGAETKDPSVLRDIADQLEINKQLKLLLQNGKHMREYMLLKFPHIYAHQWEYLRNESSAAGTGPKLFHLMSELRQFPDYRCGHSGKRDLFGYVLIGNQPVWALNSKLYRVSPGTGMNGRAEELNLVTGPRSDERRADELRYYGDPKRAASEPLAILGGQAKKDVSARFQISYTPAADFWPYGHSPDAPLAFDPGRPEVAFAFGIRDIDSPRRPLRGTAAVLRADGVRLVDFSEDKSAYRVTPRESQNGDLKSAHLKVAVKIQGDSARVTVDGKSYHFKAPSDREGFFALWFRGAGYAAIHHLEVD